MLLVSLNWWVNWTPSLIVRSTRYWLDVVDVWSFCCSAKTDAWSMRTHNRCHISVVVSMKATLRAFRLRICISASISYRSVCLGELFIIAESLDHPSMNKPAWHGSAKRRTRSRCGALPRWGHISLILLILATLRFHWLCGFEATVYGVRSTKYLAIIISYFYKLNTIPLLAPSYHSARLNDMIGISTICPFPFRRRLNAGPGSVCFVYYS